MRRRRFLFVVCVAGHWRELPRLPDQWASIGLDKATKTGIIGRIKAPGARMTSMSDVHLVSHPLVQHKLSLMRETDRSTKGFRELLNEIGMLLCYEVTRDLPLEIVDIETPLMAMKAPKIAGKKLTFAPILRAGVGFLDGMLALVPSARVAHIGLYRDPESLQAVEYYFKAPTDLSDRTVILMDPMLATGNSASAAASLLRTRGAQDMRFVCLLAAPEGINHFQAEHPDVPIWTAAIDEKLNDHGYILPGLGDAGDRMYGTK
jgi:uracil phosphoribosyltransferase